MEQYPRLAIALRELARLDANGASLAITDLRDLIDDHAPEESFIRLAVEVEETVADILAREEGVE